MSTRILSHDEVNRIVNMRLSRERERLTRDYESRMKRCMASLHLMLYQEMCEMKRDATIEMQEPLLQDIDPNETDLFPFHPERKHNKGGIRK